MLNQFERTELLLGKSGLEKLRLSRVAVFGIGGVGGYAVEALVRSGVGAVDLIDGDVFSFTNLNRQLFATRTTLGKYKVEAAAERIAQINPGCRVRVFKIFYSSETESALDFRDYDYIIDAVDTVPSKVAIVRRAQALAVPVISSMGTGNKLDPAKLEVADIFETSVCPLARVMRRELKKAGIDHLKVVYSKEEPIRPPREESREVSERECLFSGAAQQGFMQRAATGSTAFVPAAAGMILAAEVVKDLIGNLANVSSGKTARQKDLS